MKYIINIILGVAFLLTVFSLNAIYGNGIIGFVVLMVLTFMGIVVLLSANHSDQ